MSSEEYASSSPRIRQFGLYKSFDSRTEDFLRLSRKRQIRQGCACAAVSTALTVTVVVVVIFVFEFTFNSEIAAVRLRLRPNWNSPTNDTDDIFEKRYMNKNAGKNALTLLPIFIKALKKNVFLEKIFEEQSSSHPTVDKDTTDNSYGRQILSRDWFRVTPRRFYAIAYKPSSFADKKATTNQAYFTKKRKIREYERISNYFDKMINDKGSYIGSSQPMLSLEAKTEKSTSNVKKSKQYYKNRFPKKVATITKAKKDDAISNDCKCITKLGSVLDKFLNVIQFLITTTFKNSNSHKHSKIYEDIQVKDVSTTTVKYNIDNMSISLKKNNVKSLLVDPKIDHNEDIKINTLESNNVNERTNAEFSIYGSKLTDTQFVNLQDEVTTKQTTIFMFTPFIDMYKYKKILDDNAIMSFFNKKNEIIPRNGSKKINVPLNKKYSNIGIGQNRNIFSDRGKLKENVSKKSIIDKLVLQNKTKSAPLKKNPLKTTLSKKTGIDSKLKTNKTIVLNKKQNQRKNKTQGNYNKLEYSTFVPYTVPNLNEKSKQTQIEWEELKNENIPAHKSMTPSHRPIFLEIQRNDWRHEEHGDDYNALNNYDFTV